MGFTNDQLNLSPLDRIAVRPLGARAGQITLLAPRDISYAFPGSAAPMEVLAICIRNGWRLESSRVYVRTARAIYRTCHRSLAEFSREVADLRLFFPIGRKCVVNPHKIAMLFTDARAPLLVFFSADGQKECLTVSRRAWPVLRDWLRIPARCVDAPRVAPKSCVGVGVR